MIEQDVISKEGELNCNWRSDLINNKQLNSIKFPVLNYYYYISGLNIIIKRTPDYYCFRRNRIIIIIKQLMQLRKKTPISIPRMLNFVWESVTANPKNHGRGGVSVTSDIIDNERRFPLLGRGVEGPHGRTITRPYIWWNSDVSKVGVCPYLLVSSMFYPMFWAPAGTLCGYNHNKDKGWYECYTQHYHIL